MKDGDDGKTIPMNPELQALANAAMGSGCPHLFQVDVSLSEVTRFSLCKCDTCNCVATVGEILWMLAGGTIARTAFAQQQQEAFEKHILENAPAQGGIN